MRTRATPRFDAASGIPGVAERTLFSTREDESFFLGFILLNAFRFAFGDGVAFLDLDAKVVKAPARTQLSNLGKWGSAA